ncbi:MAG: biopolymer transporter ExbD [Spirochaetales bacterium]|nr:biopolymer transporter ExbD [Spirochaetales bacterium]
MNLRSRRKQTLLPLAAMGDIAFLLLIFYMATTLVTDQKPRDVDLARVRAESQQSPFPLIIYLDGDLASRGRAFFFNQEVALNSLAGEIQREASGSPGAIKVYLNIDRSLPYRFLNQVIEELKTAGVKNLIITTRRTE